jgi:hypothetical protein|tara:strand:- start:590 stop:883 length:294 start_codon:yes stop_codon:yes gene_type:complete
MFNKNQEERLYKASAAGGGEINPNKSHAEQWSNLPKETVDKIMRRVLQVQFELVHESPNKFTVNQIDYIKNEMKKAVFKEQREGLRFNYETKELEKI